MQHFCTLDNLVTYVSFAHIIWIFVDVSGKSKITNLYNIILGQKDVSCSQIAMDALNWKTKKNLYI